MNISHVYDGPRTGIKDCPECGGVGLFLEPHLRGARFPVLSICRCVTQQCYVCPSSGKPPFMQYDEEANKMLPCFCHDVRGMFSLLERLIQESRIPPRYQYKFLDSINTQVDGTISLLVAHDWAGTLIKHYKNSKVKLQGMYLSGKTGSGKTHLACAILNELIFRYQVECRYVKVSKDFLEVLKASYQRDSDFYGQARDIESELANIEVLVIDDFGAQKDTEWSNSKLYDLIDYRYERDKLTLLTSNQPLEEWADKAEGRLHSRLCEMTQEIVIDCPDYRVRFMNGTR